jgi:hypothetical protein
MPGPGAYFTSSTPPNPCPHNSRRSKLQSQNQTKTLFGTHKELKDVIADVLEHSKAHNQEKTKPQSPKKEVKI